MQAPLPGLIVHRVRVLRGEVRPGDPALAQIDVGRRARCRAATRRPTWCTRRCGTSSATRPRRPARSTRPAGCASTSTLPAAVAPSVLADVEDEINEVLLRDLEVQVVRHRPGRSAPDRGDGAVRREVRRPGAGRRGRRLLPRAVRRHARPRSSVTRPGEDPRRGVDRLRRAPGRGARRPGRLPVPRSRARPGERTRR